MKAGSREEAHRFYAKVWETGHWPSIGALGIEDRFFLLTWLLNGFFADRDWVYARVREVEAAPDGYLDLWARTHFKSTAITFAGAIQEIVKNPEITIGIFSYNFANAKKFHIQIKRELEDNERLKAAYPHILWDNAKKAPLWTEEQGLIVRRRGNPKEATVTPHGLIEGPPAGPHYDLRIYDDVVTEKEVTTPEMMEKAAKMWRQSQNNGKEGGRAWHVGTRYHFNDPYSIMLREQLLTPRVYPATDDSTPEGKPVLVAPEYMAECRRQLGPYLFACQWLLNPVADDAQGFKREWLRHYEGELQAWKSFNRYITVDPANEKKKNSDFSVFWVLGLGADKNVYVLDCVRERLNLTQRADTLFRLHRKWQPKAVAYEKYGKDSDIQHFQDRMGRENYRFSITEVGGQLKKEDRIRRLIPWFEQGRIWTPERMFRSSDGRTIDLIAHFVEQEYLAFPVAVHDDMLDALARLLDEAITLTWPKEDEDAMKYSQSRRRSRYDRKVHTQNLSWMSM